MSQQTVTATDTDFTITRTFPAPPAKVCVMSVSFTERDGRTLAVHGQNVVGPFSCDQAIAGATATLDGFEEYLGTV